MFSEATVWWVLWTTVLFPSASLLSSHFLICSSSSNSPLFQVPLFPFIPLLLRGTAELFIKQTSSLSMIDFWPTCVFLNDKLSVVLLPALPHLCHYSFQRLHLSAQTYSALSSLSSNKIYVGISNSSLSPITQKKLVTGYLKKQVICILTANTIFFVLFFILFNSKAMSILNATNKYMFGLSIVIACKTVWTLMPDLE